MNDDRTKLHKTLVILEGTFGCISFPELLEIFTFCQALSQIIYVWTAKYLLYFCIKFSEKEHS